MELRIKVKPTIITARSKELIKINISSRFRTFSTIGTNGNCLMDREGNKYGINYEKRRKKVTQKKTKNNKTKSTVITQPHWVAFIYKFDKNIPIIINQKTRNFDYKLKTK